MNKAEVATTDMMIFVMLNGSPTEYKNARSFFEGL